MQIGSELEFECLGTECDARVRFSVLDVDQNHIVKCSECGMEYPFDERLVSQLRKFENLCRVLHDSKEILSDTHVAIDMQGHNVRIPFRLLLTRLNNELRLDIDGKEIMIGFRLMPLESMPERAQGSSE